MIAIRNRLRRALRRRSTYGFVAVAAVIVVFLALATGGSDAEDPDTGLRDIERGPDIDIVIPAGEPLVIGVSSALTGANASRGLEYRDAVVVAVQQWMEANGEQIGGHAIRVVAEDDGCTEADVTTVAARRHAQRPGLVGVIGPQCSGGALAVLPIYAEAGIVAISGSATLSELADEQPAGRFFFRTAYRNDTQGILFGVYVADPEFLGADDAYIVDDSEAYGRGLAADIERELLSVELPSGGQARVRVTRASIEPGAVDFSDLAAEIARADPDAVIFAGRNPAAGLLLRQLRDAGWDGSYATGDGVCGGPGCDFLVSLGALAEGVAFSGCTPPLPTTFVDDFEAVHDDSDPDDDHGRPTASFVAHYADAATILLDAVAAVALSQADGSLRVDPTLLRGVVAAALLSGGLSGDVAFDSSGDRRLMGEITGLEHVARELGLVPCFVENGMIAYFN